MFLFPSSRQNKSAERRRSKRDDGRDSPTSTRLSREKRRSRGSRSSRKSSSRDNVYEDDEYVEEPYEPTTDLPIRPGRKVSMLVPEMERRRSSNPRSSNPRSSNPSSNDSKSSLPYPSFSKAHSRESVNSKEDLSQPPRKASLYTPDTTEAGQGRSKSPLSRTVHGDAPPSPPLTADVSNLRKVVSGSSMRQETENLENAQRSGSRPRGATSPLKQPRFSASRSSLRQAEEGRSNLQPPKDSRTPESSPERLQTTASPLHRKSKSLMTDVRLSQQGSGSPRGGRSQTGSDATAVGPTHKTSQKFEPANGARNPTTLPMREQSNLNASKDDRSASQDSRPHAEDEDDANTVQVPPPPPPMMPTTVHKVDYLLQNGGLAGTLPRVFASAAQPSAPKNYVQYNSPQTTPVRSRATDLQKVFQPFNTLLDDYSTVLNKHGSIAVATGYRSVARRLLDRLEHVFARNISSEACSCVMCKQFVDISTPHDQDTGVSWGEVLEFVSGRRELPSWPPFSLPASGPGLGIVDGEHEAPMQKLDIDVPEEFREHYIKQSKKTKLVVQNWLASQPETHVSPPQEVDDDTLTFAMLTYLEPEQRRIFAALMRGMSTVPDLRTPTPLPLGPRTDFMSKIGLSLQRLYRLPRPPRDPESAMFLLQNPNLHNVLATLSAISSQEWDILVSGRFNGFLWSGADDQATAQSSSGLPPPPRSNNWSGRSSSFSRTTTPINTFGGVAPPRTAPPLANGSNLPPGAVTPQSSGGSVPSTPNPQSSNTANGAGPVAMDEDTELAVLAEVEREIFTGMEALEDAFEALHTKAEAVRTALRERSAGLALSAQSRRGSEQVEVRTDTPASTTGWPGLSATPLGMRGLNPSFANGPESEAGWSIDGASELAPDDSASNIGFRQKHRRKRRVRRETRTPAAVEEE